MPNPSLLRQSPELVSLGGAIRALRLAAGMSQEELAHLAEVDRSYLGRVERGDNNVAIMTLCRVAQALGVSGAQLLELAHL
ncbi:helix-turn-helix domain-containing protein [Massilia pinisoli]|uniref:Helix-turn-helix domain-containing protein n=1 Tax=Massilia pinisoli TaxID=1772194 RepID=A0ABT1ZM97_9BURK|nr:helix-turn-helix domain-containing protein [Massilia pinisoli]